MLTVEGAKDIIDTYGPLRSRWPKEHVSTLDALLTGDDDLKSYLKRAKKIDAMLNNWDEAIDGADVEDDEKETDDREDDEPSDQPDDEEEDEELAPIHLDDRQLADMDEMFADAIQALIDLNQHRGMFNVFSRDKDKLVDIPVPSGQTTEDIDKAVAKAVGPLMKDLRRMIAARSQVRRIPGKRSGRLHAPSLHRIKIGDDRVFSRKEEAPSLNTAISLLLDCSGSMNGPRIRLATETAYALGCVLNKLGIAFECLGFTDSYDDCDAAWSKAAQDADKLHPIARFLPLVMPRYKAFEDRWTTPVQQRFAAVFDGGRPGQMGGTPEGCGMEFAAKRLLGRTEERKIMMVMTDGEPGSASLSAGLGAYAKQSHDMVKSIELAGIDLIGIGIQHNGPSNYYTNSLCINNVEEMPKMLLGVLRKFIIG